MGQQTGANVVVGIGVLLLLIGVGITARPGVFWTAASRRPLVMALAAVRIVGVIVAFTGLVVLILGVTG